MSRLAPPDLDRRPRPRRRRADPRRPPSALADARARDEEAADAARHALSSTSSTSRSTRTSSSFELAAKRLSADTMSIKAGRLVGRQGRVAQGHGADALGLRPGRDRRPPPAYRRAARSSRGTEAHVVNAGDGKHQHPTQALLDLYTLRERARPARRAARGDRRRRAPLAGRALARAGARARRRARRRSSARRRCCRAGSRRSAARSRIDIDAIGDADVVYVLRMQRERMLRARPSCRRCASTPPAGASRRSGCGRDSW